MRRAPAILACVALLGLGASGCTLRGTASFETDGVHVDLVAAGKGEAAACGRGTYYGFYGLTADRLSEESCRLSGTVGYDKLRSSLPGPAARQVADRWFVSMPVPGGATNGVERSITEADVTVRLPGPVRSASEHVEVDGDTIRITDPAAFKVTGGAWAVASDGTLVRPDDLLLPGGVLAGALAAGLGAWLLGRMRRPPQVSVAPDEAEADRTPARVAEPGVLDAAALHPSPRIEDPPPSQAHDAADVPEDPSVWAPDADEGDADPGR